MQEQVNYVHVQVNCCQNVFFWGQVSHHLLSIEDQEQAEEDSTTERQEELQARALYEDLKDAPNNENTQSSHEAETKNNHHTLVFSQSFTRNTLNISLEI